MATRGADRGERVPGWTEDPGEPARFVAGVAVLLAGLFTFMILVAGVAPLVLSPCADG
jgi:hypothetical protein